MLLGKTQLPDWFCHGVKEKSLLFTCKLEDISPESGKLIAWYFTMLLDFKLSQSQSFYFFTASNIFDSFVMLLISIKSTVITCI